MACIPLSPLCFLQLDSWCLCSLSGVSGLYLVPLVSLSLVLLATDVAGVPAAAVSLVWLVL